MADSTCVIGEAIQIRGKVSGSGKLIVCGRIEGEVYLNDVLTVELGGVVIAKVKARAVIIHGDFEGDTAAETIVTISQTGEIIGNVRAPQVEIEHGGRFCGHLDMEVDIPEHLLN